MHKYLTPSERTNMLADYIEARHNEHFDMSNADHCAYAFAKRMFGVEHFDFSGMTNKAMLADMLHIPYEEAVSLYCSTGFTRRDTVKYIAGSWQSVWTTRIRPLMEWLAKRPRHRPLPSLQSKLSSCNRTSHHARICLP